MNIFVLDENPKIAARYHCDKHVVKMILETAQMLSTAQDIHDSWSLDLYKPTHINHPCTRWVAASRSNYRWAYDLYLNLLREYTFRYGKHHKSERLISYLSIVPEKIAIGDRTPFVLAMPDRYKPMVQDAHITSNIVKAYREYYRNEKASFAHWTSRSTPEWML